MVRGDATAIRLLRLALFGDAEQDIMGLVHVGGGEHAVVGGDEGEGEVIGQGDEAWFQRGVARGVVAVELDDGAAGEGFAELGEEGGGIGAAAILQQGGERAGGAAGEEIQALGVGEEGLRGQAWGEGWFRLQEGERGETAEIGETGGVLGEQDDGVGGAAGLVGAGEGELTADDGLHAGLGAGLAEFQRAEEVAGVGDGGGGLLVGAGQGCDVVWLDGAFAERVGGVGAQVDVLGWHLAFIGGRALARKASFSEEKEAKRLLSVWSSFFVDGLRGGWGQVQGEGWIMTDAISSATQDGPVHRLGALYKQAEAAGEGAAAVKAFGDSVAGDTRGSGVTVTLSGATASLNAVVAQTAKQFGGSEGTLTSPSGASTLRGDFEGASAAYSQLVSSGNGVAALQAFDKNAVTDASAHGVTLDANAVNQAIAQTSAALDLVG